MYGSGGLLGRQAEIDSQRVPIPLHGALAFVPMDHQPVNPLGHRRKPENL